MVSIHEEFQFERVVSGVTVYCISWGVICFYLLILAFMTLISVESIGNVQWALRYVNTKLDIF